MLVKCFTEILHGPRTGEEVALRGPSIRGAPADHPDPADRCSAGRILRGELARPAVRDRAVARHRRPGGGVRRRGPGDLPDLSPLRSGEQGAERAPLTSRRAPHRAWDSNSSPGYA